MNNDYGKVQVPSGINKYTDAVPSGINKYIDAVPSGINKYIDALPSGTNHDKRATGGDEFREQLELGKIKISDLDLYGPSSRSLEKFQSQGNTIGVDKVDEWLDKVSKSLEELKKQGNQTEDALQELFSSLEKYGISVVNKPKHR